VKNDRAPASEARKIGAEARLPVTVPLGKSRAPAEKLNDFAYLEKKPGTLVTYRAPCYILTGPTV
jgi:hypothetical protein